MVIVAIRLCNYRCNIVYGTIEQIVQQNSNIINMYVLRIFNWIKKFIRNYDKNKAFLKTKKNHRPETQWFSYLQNNQYIRNGMSCLYFAITKKYGQRLIRHLIFCFSLLYFSS